MHNILYEPNWWEDESMMKRGVFIPAMSMHRVYKRLHCVLDLISNILYALPEETSLH